jgi:peptidoglycan/xylan/chitin deacetylase (PgdA/CDA1 family)
MCVEMVDNSSFEWPGKSGFAVCLTHDVDRVRKTYQYFTHLIKSGKIPKISLRRNPYWNFEKIRELEDSFGVKSTFFFLNEQRILFNPFKLHLFLGRYRFSEDKVKDIISVLDQSGWEIGLHGSYNSYKSENLLREEKKLLEDIVGHEIVGIRQHYLNMNGDTWRLQSNVGFKYDSSFGSSQTFGFEQGHYVPFKPISEKDFMVIPLTIMDACLMASKNITEEYTRIIDEAEENNTLLVLDWHQRVFNDSEFPGWSSVYSEIIEECLDRNAKFLNALTSIISSVKMAKENK